MALIKPGAKVSFGKRLDALLVRHQLSIPAAVRREWIELMRHLTVREAEAALHRGIKFQAHMGPTARGPSSYQGNGGPGNGGPGRGSSPASLQQALAEGSLSSLAPPTAGRPSQTSTGSLDAWDSFDQESTQGEIPSLAYYSTPASTEAKVVRGRVASLPDKGEARIPTRHPWDPEEPDLSTPRSAEPGTSGYLSARYEDLGVIATGGMGEVRLVRDRELNRRMVMKVLRLKWLEHPEVMMRFLEEAQTTAQLQHPGVVPVHELGYLPDGRIYFTMKEIRGCTLSESIRDFHHNIGEESLPLEQLHRQFWRLVQAFSRVCKTVAWAHTRGVVHRDLKPENVMLSPLDEVIVIDWGLARVEDRGDLMPFMPSSEEILTQRSSQDDAWSTHLGEVIGTPAYMPPEQARGDHDQLGPAADIYALGAILYELLAGRPPYEGESFVRVLYKVLEGPPLPPLPLPSEVQTKAGKGSAAPGAPANGGAPATGAPAYGGPARAEESPPEAVTPGTDPSMPAITPPRGTAISAQLLATFQESLAGSESGFDVPSSDPILSTLPPLRWQPPDALLDLCNKAMARHPDDRFDDVTEMLHHLQSWLDDALD